MYFYALAFISGIDNLKDKYSKLLLAFEGTTDIFWMFIDNMSNQPVNVGWFESFTARELHNHFSFLDGI